MRKIIKIVCFFMAFTLLLPINIVSAEDVYIGNTSYAIRTREGGSAPLIKIEDNSAYCLEFQKKVPNNSYYKKINYSNKNIEALIYSGYPTNAYNLIEKYLLTEEEAISYTQKALWYYLEGWDREYINAVEVPKEGYILELLNIADNAIIPKKDIYFSDTVKFNDVEDYEESNYIKSSGVSGKFIVKTSENIICLDKNNNIRYNYDVGEEFKLRRENEENINPSNITIEYLYTEPKLIVYESEDEKVQDLVRVEEYNTYVNKNLTIENTNSVNEEVPQIPKTGENNTHILVIFFISGLVLILLCRGFGKES